MIAEIENAIIDTLKNATGMAYLTGVESYGGELDDDLNEVVRKFPAVWVVFAGSAKPVKFGAEKFKVPATFAVIVAARNVRNEKATRQGASSEVGTYQMLQDVRTLLMNNDFGLAIERLQPGATRTLYNTKIRGQALSIFSQEWTTAYVDAVPKATEVDLLRFGINYFIKPGDDIADASDILEVTN